MSALRRFIAVALIFFMLPACSMLAKEPQVSVKRTSVVGLDTAGMDIELYLGIRNNNQYELSLLGYTYNLRVAALPLTSGGLQEKVIFPGDKETELRIPLRIKFNELIEIIKSSPDPDRIPYRVDARLHLGTPVGEMLIPVKHEATFSVPARYRPATYLDKLKNIFR